MLEPLEMEGTAALDELFGHMGGFVEQTREQEDSKPTDDGGRNSLREDDGNKGDEGVVGVVRDHLPVELVTRIVRLSFASPDAPLLHTATRNRHDILRTFCQVSKSFRDIAQPLLSEKVSLETAKSLDLFLDAVRLPELGGLVKRI
ncbi:hypothetical protein JCM8547_005344 [Rhodosporidiobolus lusitaniae]